MKPLFRKPRNLVFPSVLIGALLCLTQCGKIGKDLQLSSLKAGLVEVSKTDTAAGVPVSLTIEAVFSEPVDSLSLAGGSISLARAFDGNEIPVTFRTEGEKVVLLPGEFLTPGAVYAIRFSGRIESETGKEFTEQTRWFRAEGIFYPEGALAFWNFEGDARDQAGHFHPSQSGVVTLAWEDSWCREAGQSARFDGDRSIIEIPKADTLLETSDFTLAFWVKTESSGHVNETGQPAGYLVMGLGAFLGFEFDIAADFSYCKLAARYVTQSGKTLSDDLQFSGDGQSWQGWEFNRDLTGSGGLQKLLKDKWVHVVCTFEAASRRGSLYLNGQKMKVLNFNLWPENDLRRTITGMKFSGSPPETTGDLAFGFFQSRAGTLLDNHLQYGYDFPTADHFKGNLDDVMILHRCLYAEEISLMSFLNR